MPGYLVGTILDAFDNGMPVAIADISATCHMPDVLEAPYRPAMLGEVPLPFRGGAGGGVCRTNAAPDRHTPPQPLP